VELHRVAGDGYVVRVRDDGVGFPQALDYRRTETLGMQIVNTLVGQLEGRLELENKTPGSTFRLEFNELPMKRKT
jgi:two-component sensor histidine kinase